MKTQGWLQAEDLFYKDFNDISIFIEDQAKENLYYTLFRRFVSGLRVEKIFPLGGKAEVLRRARDCSDESAYYILDKDWDDIRRKIVPHRRAIYLGRYSIENYFLDDGSAFLEFFAAENPLRRIDKLETLMDFEATKSKMLSEGVALHSLLLRVQRIEDELQLRMPPVSLGISLTQSGIDRFCNDGTVCELKIARVRDDLVERLGTIGLDKTKLENVDEEMLYMGVRSKESDGRVQNFHGKIALGILFRLLCCRINWRSRVTIDSLMVHLAQRSKCSAFGGVCDLLIKKYKLSRGQSPRRGKLRGRRAKGRDEPGGRGMIRGHR